MKELILWETDSTTVRKLFERLGNDRDTRKALKKALNETADHARVMLADKAQGSYTVKKVDFDREMKLRKASASRLLAVIRATGEPLELRSFKTSEEGGTLKAQILKQGSLKEIKKGSIKAFVNNIAKKGQVRSKNTRKGKAGSAVIHFAAAQRKGKERLKVKTLFSSSVPVMLGSAEHVYGVVEPEIESDLRKCLNSHIAQISGG